MSGLSETSGILAVKSVHFAPLMPLSWLVALCGLAVIILILSAVLQRKAILMRLLCALSFALLLLNPSLTEEERKPVKDVAAIVVDASPSQNFGNRNERAQAALAHFEKTLAEFEDTLEVRVTTAPLTQDVIVSETNLFDALENLYGDVQPSRRAGVIIITDGQVHDVPETSNFYQDYGPLHFFLTGNKNDIDRRLMIIEAPAYGVVGEEVTIKYKIIDQGTNNSQRTARITSEANDSSPVTRTAPVGVEQSMTFLIEHAGQNIIHLEAEALNNELTTANNAVPLIVNGVRNRLKVLLVSGQPHAGGRMWRDLLTADPGVDLVHFTILREPHKLDSTPQRELSLIAFPFRELFEIKLYDFDLIIFDRYKLNRILPHFYFSNIARYVREGGALLEASGPSFANENSLYTTALKDILPAYPTGQVIEQAYTPSISDKGKLHPVTKNLTWNSAAPGNDKEWGQWLRQIIVRPMSGHVLMAGHNDSPLMILDRVGEGRVAQIASDHLWLWARNYDGGGPQAELLRRTAHWLMKEPELEENALHVRGAGNRVHIERRSLTPIPLEVEITAPDQTKQKLTLQPDENGLLQGNVEAVMPGVYEVSDGMQTRFAVIGALNPPEYRDVISTEEKVKAIADATNGSIKWLVDIQNPDVRMISNTQRSSGNGWVGLLQNNDYDVQGVRNMPFLPLWVYALIMILLCMTCWWFEGRRKTKIN